MHDYSNYTLADFLKDETFQQWVFAPDAGNEAHWQQVATLYPQQEPVIRQAKQLLLSVGFNEYVLHPADQQHTLDLILESIHAPAGGKRVVMRPALRRWLHIAAVVAGIIVAAFTYFLVSGNREVSYATGYGQQQTVTLPDGSEVMLRSHSTLTFKTSAFSKAHRDVWLMGEAIFRVKHLEDARKFIVHTSDNFSVEVLGTQFLVHKRDNATMVYLHSGKVRLHVNEKNNIPPDALILKPGEAARFAGNHPSGLLKQEKPVAGIASWDGKSILLDNTTLKEVADFLHDNYGFQVHVADTADLQVKVSGTLPLGNLDTLLINLSAVYDLSFSSPNEKTILISDHQ